MRDDPAVAAWVEAWRDARVNIAILAVLLAALTAIFVFQAQLARSRLAHRLVRNGFLAVVLVWLRWVARGPPSASHGLNHEPAPFPGLRIRLSLAPPLMGVYPCHTPLSPV